MKKSGFLLLLLFSFLSFQAQVLPVHLVTQEQNQWCWAGVSACVLDYYCHTTSQCEIADYARTVETFPDVFLGNADCCLSPSTCNYWNYNWGGNGSIQDILIHFANIANTGVGGVLSEAEIQMEIQNNRLFVIRWGWTSGGGHFIVGHGLIGNNLYYMNPWYGEGLLIGNYSWMCSGSGHNWTHTNRLDSIPAFSIPPTPIISLNGSILHSNTPSGNQWYNESGEINGADIQDYQPLTSGNYYVIVSNESCSSDTSNHISVNLSGIENKTLNTIKVFPNPFSDQLLIENPTNQEINCIIYNIMGMNIMQKGFEGNGVINTQQLSKGIYFIALSDGTSASFRKIIKQ